MILKIVLFALIGAAGGVIGGMGMGGGTLLIPLLTLFTNTDQHLAQAVNLVAFIPMSVVALIVHAKHKLLKGRYLLSVALPAACASVPASLLVRKVQSKVLSRSFGIFLAVLGLWQLVSLLVSRAIDTKKKRANTQRNLYKTVYK